MMRVISSSVFLLSVFSFFLLLSVYIYAQNSLSVADNEKQTVEVVVDSYSFSPDIISVEVNRPVELKLRSVTSIIPHNFSMNYPDAGLEIDVDIGSGKDVIVTFTPTKVGEYEFYCSKKSIFANHKKKGMVGKLTVTE